MTCLAASNRGRLAGEDVRFGDRRGDAVLADRKVLVDDVEGVQELALVLVDALDLDVEERRRSTAIRVVSAIWRRAAPCSAA